MSRLFVKNLPKQITQNALKELFSKSGTVTDCSLKYTKDGTFRRFAVIGFSTEEAAKAAQKFYHETYIRTSKIHVEFAVDFNSNQRPRPWSKFTKTEESKKIDSKTKDMEIKYTEKAKALKKKEEEKNSNLYGDLAEDPDFKEFVGLYTDKSRLSVWHDDKLSKTDGTSVTEDKGDEDTDAESTSTKPMSDLDFFKSKMVDSQVDFSDDEDNEKGKACKLQKLSQKKLETDARQQDKEKTEKAPRHSKFCLKMKGLPPSVKMDAIRDFFAPLKVKVNLPLNKNKQKIGIAFVECRSEKDREAAMTKNKSFIGKNKIFLRQMFEEPIVVKTKEKAPKPWEQKQQESGGVESIAESGRLFVRNLAYVCTEADLETLFQKYGPLAEVDLPLDPVTKSNKGFGHVVYRMPEDAVKAFKELDHKGFMGRILHLVPGKELKKTDASSEKSSFQKKKEEKRKSWPKTLQYKDWNTVFLSSDTVTREIAARFDTDKGHFLDDSGEVRGSLGVRMALAEAHLVRETRQFLIQNGVALDSFTQGPSGMRSKTVILIKDLPPSTPKDSLREEFEKWGTVTRFVMPPAAMAALVEFQERSEASMAMKKLFFKTFNGRPLHLEWAHMAVFDKKKEDDEEMETEEADQDTEAPETETTQTEETESAEKGATLYVKNINFNTSEAALKECFSKAGDVRQVQIATRSNPKKPGEILSCGYGFVEFKKAQFAKEALRSMDGQLLDGHRLQLQFSKNPILEPESSQKEEMDMAEHTTILVRNIPFRCTKKEIKDLFQVFGRLKGVRLPKKPTGDGCRGFAFVDFLTKQEAKQAFEGMCHSCHLFGRRLVLEWASTADTVENLQRKTAKKFADGGPPAKRRA